MPISKLKVKSSSLKTKTSGLNIEVYDVKGKVVEKIELPKELFGQKQNPKLLAQAVRVYLANQRSGTASTKTRGEVQGSSRKIYKQKGTGRARHGSIRAPIFVKGGVVFGPKPHDFSLKLSKKIKRKALASALSAKLLEGGVKIVKDLSGVPAKTKSMVEVLTKLELNSKNKNILFAVGEIKTGQAEGNFIKAVRNIAGVRYLPASQLNTYEVLDTKSLVITQDAIPILIKTFVRKE